MDRLRELFSRRSLPKLAFIAAIYLLGRMEGEGRFRWHDVLSFTFDKVVATGTAAAESARGLVGM